MAYQAYITTIKDLRKHPNADRLQLGECFGNTVCVSLEYTDNQIGVYFPTDGQLSKEYCEHNNLLRKKDEFGKNIGGYMDPDKRNVTSIRLRGEKSDGLFMPLSSLEFTGVDLDSLKVGDAFSALNGQEICTKYIPRRKRTPGTPKAGNRTRKKKVPVAPLFVEHADTEQLAYNMDAFRVGDQIEITLKMHGTSQRTAYVPRVVDIKANNLIARYGKKFINKHEHLSKLQKWAVDYFDKHSTPVYDWGYVTGTRRTVLDGFEDGGFYGSNEFREPHAKAFEGKLLKGEEVYYEVVGFTTTGQSIMGEVSNKKLNDKEFVKRYGETTQFSYGCSPDGKKRLYGRDDDGDFVIDTQVPQSDFYVYRMTMTNEDGDMVEYTPDYMRYRCEQMGVKCVPVFWKGYIEKEKLRAVYDIDFPKSEEKVETPGEFIKDIAERFYDGPDPVGKTHVREGVVVRIVNRPKFTAYKHKNFSFKVLEGIAKVEAEAPDMEEAQEIERDNNEESV